MSGNKLRVLALVHRHLIPPETIPAGTDLESAPWRTEYDVATTLRAMGHEVQMLAVHDDLGDIRAGHRQVDNIRDVFGLVKRGNNDR